MRPARTGLSETAAGVAWLAPPRAAWMAPVRGAWLAPLQAAALAALLAAAGCGDRGTGGGSDEAPPARAPMYAGIAPAPGARVLIIGLDGADWEIIDRLESLGRLPVLARLAREGARGTLRSEDPLLSPVVWTTIATGRSPADHGIFGFLTQRAGKTEPVRSDERKVRAFWNVATDMGVPVGVVGWYASWPAERVNGFLVSDRLGSHQIEGGASGKGGASGSGGAEQALVSPASIGAELDTLREAVARDVDGSAAARWYFSRPARAPGAPEIPVQIEADRLAAFVNILRTEELYRRLAPVLLKRFDPVIGAVYFEGTDAVGHLFAEFTPPPIAGTDPARAAALGEVFDRYYDYQDTILGELLESVDPSKTTVVIVSDHGFRTGARRPGVPSSVAGANQAPLWHRPEGIVLLWGRGVRAGARIPDASIYDVMPTVFRLVGLPAARTWKGRPIESALLGEALPAPVEPVADFEAAGPIERTLIGEADDSGSGEQLEKLRALGYVGGAGSGAGGGEGQGAIPLNRYNEGIILLEAGRTDEAFAVFRALQAEAPGLPLGWVGEGYVRMKQNRPADAIAPLETALKLDPRVAGANMTLGEAYMRAGRPDEAVAALRRVMERDPANARAALMLGELLLGKRMFEEAGRWLTVAKERSEEPGLRAGSAVGLAILAEERRELDLAASLYENALAAAPGFPPALERYANLQMYRGNSASAADLLGQLVAQGKAGADAYALYGRALALVGRREEARAALDRALALEPGREDIRKLAASLK